MAGKLWYPIFLDLEGRPVVVIGAGRVALRKVHGLLEAGARVKVVAPHWHPGFEDLPVERIEREFDGSDLQGAVLVFAATSDREANHRAAVLAAELGIPANIADFRGDCTFIVPARVNRANLQIAISTGGEDPRRAAEVRRKVEDWLNLVRP